MSVQIRPMTAEDAEAVDVVVTEADRAADEKAGREVQPHSPERTERFQAGMRRFVEVDPGGAWVAEDDQGVAGMAEAIRRDDFWGLSMLFVHPRAQSQGVGRQLLDKTLGYAEGAKVRMIMASDDPRALRRYSRAGLAIHPGVEASGKVDRSKIPADLPGREGTNADLDLVAAADRSWGRDRSFDVAAILELGGGFLEVVDLGDRCGYGLQRDGRIVMIGATDTDTAALVMWRLLSKAEEKAEVWCLTAAQDWAVKVALEAGLAIKPGGAMFCSGLDALPQPWVPSGWYF
jgi:GNAT superfamily N-acetyltransferase